MLERKDEERRCSTSLWPVSGASGRYVLVMLTFGTSRSGPSGQVTERDEEAYDCGCWG